MIRKNAITLLTLLAYLPLSLGLSSPSLADGAEIYEEYCGVCHGYDGVPMIPEAPNFMEGERMEKSDADLLQSIANGLGEIMPPWKDEITEADRKECLAYIRKNIVKK